MPGAFYAPAVLRGVPPGAQLLRERAPGPGAGRRGGGERGGRDRARPGRPAVSVWSGDRARGERVARTLGAEVAWVNEHGHSIPGAAVRLAGHVDAHRLASQPTRLRSARWLPYDPALVRASTATARLLHGRENERLGVLRSGAVPLARTAVRLAREALDAEVTRRAAVAVSGANVSALGRRVVRTGVSSHAARSARVREETPLPDPLPPSRL